MRVPPNLSELDAEIKIHFPGLRSLDRPSIFAFPKLVVCLDCGLTESILFEAEIRQLRESASRLSESLTSDLCRDRPLLQTRDHPVRY